MISLFPKDDNSGPVIGFKMLIWLCIFFSPGIGLILLVTPESVTGFYSAIRPTILARALFFWTEGFGAWFIGIAVTSLITMALIESIGRFIVKERETRIAEQVERRTAAAIKQERLKLHKELDLYYEQRKLDCDSRFEQLHYEEKRNEEYNQKLRNTVSAWEKNHEKYRLELQAEFQKKEMDLNQIKHAFEEENHLLLVTINDFRETSAKVIQILAEAERRRIEGKHQDVKRAIQKALKCLNNPTEQQE